MTGYVVLGFVIGVAIGYLIFYFRYQHKDVVNELRSNLKDANREIRILNQDVEEFSQQNEILKSQMTDFLQKNDDLSKVVGELSKYYYHIKKASEKTLELSKFLQEPDVIIEEKMNIYLSSNNKTQDENQAKDFF